METQNFKAWIWQDGQEFAFPFDSEHYQMVSDGDIEKSLVKGCIRIAKFKEQIAIGVHVLNEDILYRISKFFRLRNVTIGAFYLEVKEDNSLLQFKSIFELQNYLQLA